MLYLYLPWVLILLFFYTVTLFFVVVTSGLKIAIIYFLFFISHLIPKNEDLNYYAVIHLHINLYNDKLNNFFHFSGNLTDNWHCTTFYDLRFMIPKICTVYCIYISLQFLNKMQFVYSLWFWLILLIVFSCSFNKYYLLSHVM